MSAILEKNAFSINFPSSSLLILLQQHQFIILSQAQFLSLLLILDIIFNFLKNVAKEAEWLLGAFWLPAATHSSLSHSLVAFANIEFMTPVVYLKT